MKKGIYKIDWWSDKAFVAELDKEFNAWRDGKEKGYTLAEIEEEINLLRKKRKNSRTSSLRK